MTTDELREWLRENLVIDVAEFDESGQGNSVRVSLRFKDECDAFCSEHIYIPEA